MNNGQRNARTRRITPAGFFLSLNPGAWRIGYWVNMAAKRYMNDRIYTTWTYRGETSMYDPKGKYCPGSDCYMRTYSVRVPRRLLNSDSELDEWLEANQEKDIWL